MIYYNYSKNNEAERQKVEGKIMMYTEEMKKAIKTVDTVINSAIREWENGTKTRMLHHNFECLSEFILHKLYCKLEKAVDEFTVLRIKKEIYGFKHPEARNFAINHDDITEEELIEDLIENCEYSEEEAKDFAEQVRTYKNL